MKKAFSVAVQICVSIFLILFATAFIAPVHAQSSPTPVMFVNGIQNTLPKAISAVLKIKKTLDASVLHVGASRREFVVSVVWNPIGWYGDPTTTALLTLPQDNIELFLLKTAEEQYLDSMSKILSPVNSTRQLDIQAASRVASYLDDMTPGGNGLELAGVGDKQMNGTQRTVRTLVSRMASSDRAILVAHSQGNLLANLAWAKTVATQGQAAASRYRVVNVANTSRFAISGLDLTHPMDYALLLLKGLPLGLGTTVASRQTPECFGVCPFQVMAPMFASPGLDVIGHGLEEVYLSTMNLPLGSNTYGIEFSPGFTKFVDRFEDLVYAAAFSLEKTAVPELPADYPAFMKSIVEQQATDPKTGLVQRGSLAANSIDWMQGYYYGTDSTNGECSVHVSKGGVITFTDVAGVGSATLDGEREDLVHVSPSDDLALAVQGIGYGYWGFTVQAWQNRILNVNGTSVTLPDTIIKLAGAGGQLQYVSREGIKTNSCWIRTRSSAAFTGQVGMPALSGYKLVATGAVASDIPAAVAGKEFLGYAVGGMSPTMPMPSPCRITVDGGGTIGVSTAEGTWSASINGDKNGDVRDSNSPQAEFGALEYGNTRYVYGIEATDADGAGGFRKILFQFHSSATTFGGIAARVLTRASADAPIVRAQTCYVFP